MAYTFENGAWGSFNDGIATTDFANKLRQLGFTNSKKFEYPLGTSTVYSRTDIKVKWNYDFLCVLSIGVSGANYRVWVKTLPDLFQFLREIQASQYEPYSEPEDHVQGLVNYLQGTYFDEAMQALYRHFAKGQQSQQSGGIVRRVIRRRRRPPNV